MCVCGEGGGVLVSTVRRCYGMVHPYSVIEIRVQCVCVCGEGGGGVSLHSTEVLWYGSSLLCD